MKQRSPFGKFLLVLIILAIFVLLGFTLFTLRAANMQFGEPGRGVSLVSQIRYGFALNRAKDTLFSVMASNGLAERKFTISEQEPAESICERLAIEGFVAAAGPTCDYLIYSGKDRAIRPGTYTIPAGLNSVQTADLVSDVSRRDISLTIWPGWRVEEVAQAVSGAGFEITYDDFLAYVQFPPTHIAQRLELPENATLEGFLFPGTYSFKPDITLPELAAALLTEFTLAVQTDELENAFNARGLSTYEALTLASIIQRETQAAEEMPMMASVFFNRISIDMPLQTDPTVQYALGYDAASQTWWQSPLTLDNLQVNSPYNTYITRGLPPGPISSPAMVAILAVANAVESDYFYFRAKCDGSMTHNFAVTFEEHLANGCE